MGLLNVFRDFIMGVEPPKFPEPRLAEPTQSTFADQMHPYNAPRYMSGISYRERRALQIGSVFRDAAGHINIQFDNASSIIVNKGAHDGPDPTPGMWFVFDVTTNDFEFVSDPSFLLEFACVEGI